MNFRFRPMLNELETRETPSGIDPVDPDGVPSTPTPGPAQTAPQPPTGGGAIPPVDPYAP